MQRGVCYVAALSIALAPALALARSDSGSPDSTFSKVYLDSERCGLLIQQFGQAAARGIIVTAATEAASRGADLCGAGNYAEGADTLEKAVRMLGEMPAKPRPRVLLH